MMQDRLAARDGELPFNGTDRESGIPPQAQPFDRLGLSLLEHLIRTGSARANPWFGFSVVGVLSSGGPSSSDRAIVDRNRLALVRGANGGDRNGYRSCPIHDVDHRLTALAHTVSKVGEG